MYQDNNHKIIQIIDCFGGELAINIYGAYWYFTDVCVKSL